ncbi:MAG: hypothetical protein LBB50_05215 [Oscillospiraceae bacterium]|nr:hypothetical protein [Oscillospiraceae bacterium]
MDFGSILEGIVLALQGLGGIFNAVGTVTEFFSSAWFFAEYGVSFVEWLIGFGQTVSDFFSSFAV